MSTTINYSRSGKSKKADALGMRPMQAKVWRDRAAQYLLLKAPPAAGKSRALMFVALDKLHRQGVRKVIVAVPERAIAGSFKNTDLKSHGFPHDWSVEPRFDLCSGMAETSAGTVARFREFMEGDATTLLCTHATLRYAFEKIDTDLFDDCLLAIDEFHHASASDASRLGELVRALMKRDKAHIMAMTGSYFRGDENAVMRPDDEARFVPVTYSYYDQLDGYEHLENLDIRYRFYQGTYLDAIGDVLNTDRRTILHIPSVNSAESTKDKRGEVDRIMGLIGVWQQEDPETGFQLVKRHGDGKIIKVADLVDDDDETRSRVRASLRAIQHRDDVDVIIALGMAKEGFDWVWCEEALTVGYRNSLTEIIQIIGRTTRDAPGKHTATFTNLVAEPRATEDQVTEGVNSLLKAISVSLLMEQVMVPKMKFFEHAYEPGRDRLRYDEATDTMHYPVIGLKPLPTERAQQRYDEDRDDILAGLYQDPEVLRSGFDPAVSPETFRQAHVSRIVEQRYPGYTEAEKAGLEDHIVAAIGALQQIRKAKAAPDDDKEDAGGSKMATLARKLLALGELKIDLIDVVNPLSIGYEIMSKTVDKSLLARIDADIESRRNPVTDDEAKANAGKIAKMIKEGNPPRADAKNPQEKRLYLIWLHLRRKRAEMQAAAGGA